MKAARRSYRMTSRAVAVEETKGRILAATAGEFWDTGSTDFSLESVADRAGVSVQTVLRHFGGKQQLFAEAARWQAEQVSETRNPEAVADVRSAVEQLVAHYEALGDGVLRLLAEEGRVPAIASMLAEGRAFHRNWCGTVFADALAGLPEPDRSRRLAQFVAICDVHTWALLRRDSGLNVEQTEQALAEMLLPLTEEE